MSTWGIQKNVLVEKLTMIPLPLRKRVVDLMTVGDEMQQENVQLRKDVKELANMGSDDLKKRVACQKENEALKIVTAKLFNKLADEQQKLEAIRGLLPKLKCDRCIGWVGEPCSEKCDHLIYKKIYDVLGVLKEMQEKEQQ